jgi:hypothetical protein
LLALLINHLLILETENMIFLVSDSLVWMVQGVLIAATVTFGDQAAWQSRVAAKPMQVIGD